MKTKLELKAQEERDEVVEEMDSNEQEMVEETERRVVQEMVSEERNVVQEPEREVVGEMDREVVEETKSDQRELGVGSYVAAVYGHRWYIAKILKVEGELYHLSYITPCRERGIGIVMTRT